MDRSFFDTSGQRPYWTLVRKNTVINGLPATLSELTDAIPAGEHIPDAKFLAYLMVGHYRQTGIKLYSALAILSRSTEKDGERICLKFSKNYDGIAVRCPEDNRFKIWEPEQRSFVEYPIAVTTLLLPR